MAEVTVGQVAGIIAFIFVAIQLIAPLVLGLLLAGYLRDSETASTWTKVNQRLVTTLWPALLRYDVSGGSRNLRFIIKILSACFPIIAILLAVAGIVTPLGLGEELNILSSTPGRFEYLRDISPYGHATSERGKARLTRVCTQGFGFMSGPIGCPYVGDVVTVDRDNGSVTYHFPDEGMSPFIPDILREIFSSGTKGKRTTISNYFDIEWRQLSTTSNKIVNNNKTFDAGLYRQLDSFILDNEYKVIEGLVVDAKDGGIGFRNHSIPVGLSRGATWQEDILFIEPEAACVNTNLTFDFTIDRGSTSSSGISNLRLVDRGGFVNLNTTYPQYDHDNAQSNPDLVARAYKAAYLNNAQTMLVLNVTNQNDEKKGLKAFAYMNSQLGKEFEMPTSTLDDYRALGISSEFGQYLHLEFANLSFSSIPDYPNPYNITKDEFDSITTICSGSGSLDIANITNIYTGCGLLRGAPSRTDGGSPSLLEHGSKWSSPMHACAATVRAIVKTVTFTYNGTDNNGLASLRVDKIEPKKYDDEKDIPLWGFEESGLNVDGIQPIWGLISDDYASHANVSSIRQPYFHLPGYQGGFAPSLTPVMDRNIPGSDFAFLAMNRVFDISDVEWPFDLVGLASMAIFTRWQKLSTSQDEAAKILNLMWTDISASAVVGTRGVLGPLNNGDEAEAAKVYVRPIGHRVTYNFVYGIPAFILALFLLTLGAFWLVSLCLGKASLEKLRRRLRQVSPGRIYTTFLYPETSTLIMPSKDWQVSNGGKLVVVSANASGAGRPFAAATGYAAQVPLMQPGIPMSPYGEQKPPL
ncbi:Uncharacterized protein SAPIO_CDS6625 [Scedosporium apiospermum]|uniref:Uncharacterized protein n=1 Tax=Pseudallescheria apiosperma TaxID=563466 RepID=A0A084G3K9_PSEDA|nr:Uncharacterized protein SAPIO_CDS6625 [Scedosporium apiospermum]KEZ41921.1 Uncharacterized protein SAPIO_CDS6625 [Scedosporium apiospermum]